MENKTVYVLPTTIWGWLFHILSLKVFFLLQWESISWLKLWKQQNAKNRNFPKLIFLWLWKNLIILCNLSSPLSSCTQQVQRNRRYFYYLKPKPQFNFSWFLFPTKITDNCSGKENITWPLGWRCVDHIFPTSTSSLSTFLHTSHQVTGRIWKLRTANMPRFSFIF